MDHAAGNKSDELVMSSAEQKNLILGIFLDFVQDADELPRYIDHVGFDLLAIADVRELPAAWLAHYRIKAGVYDVDRACNDLATWPPIAARIAELMHEKSGS